jgi:hypothetical protein
MVFVGRSCLRHLPDALEFCSSISCFEHASLTLFLTPSTKRTLLRNARLIIAVLYETCRVEQLFAPVLPESDVAHIREVQTLLIKLLVRWQNMSLWVFSYKLQHADRTYPSMNVIAGHCICASHVMLSPFSSNQLVSIQHLS